MVGLFSVATVLRLALRASITSFGVVLVSILIPLRLAILFKLEVMKEGTPPSSTVFNKLSASLVKLDLVSTLDSCTRILALSVLRVC